MIRQRRTRTRSWPISTRPARTSTSTRQTATRPRPTAAARERPEDGRSGWAAARYAASRADRLSTTLARYASSLDRLEALARRDIVASRRDETAGVRDEAADARARLAARRDEQLAAPSANPDDLRFEDEAFVCAVPDEPVTDADPRFAAISEAVAAEHGRMLSIGTTELLPGDTLEALLARAEDEVRPPPRRGRCAP
ncbi:MAG: hypothetical protein ACEQSX_19620, partial [Baekduiaceae bacterium]